MEIGTSKQSGTPGPPHSQASWPPATGYRQAKTRLLVEAFALFLILATAILYAVKGWKNYFFTGLAVHWDPKTMGEWMAWNAHNILQGKFLLPDYHANFFYPHSYTLAFGEPLWPESFVYAALYFLTDNTLFSFNGTMLFFWALSGVLLFVLLRTLDISLLVSALGAMIYCLMPYRMPYYVEFNMVLVFIFPLMILLLLRWLKEPSLANTLWFCAGYWLSATSCLYFTIMAIIVMVFVSLAFLAADRPLLRSRRFYLCGILLLLLVAAISAVYLYPYALLKLEGGYQRSMADYMKYFAQPMHYLDTVSAPLLKWIAIPRPRFTETFLFPGTVLSLLTLTALAYWTRDFCQRDSFRTFSGCLTATKAICWMFFWTMILVHAVLGPVDFLQKVDPFLHHLALFLMLASIAGLFFPANPENRTRILLAGLATAAVVCFFVSCGPFITVGADHHRLVIARGPFLDLASWNPLFSAVRSLTRFAIVIMTFLTVAGCYVLHLLLQKHGRAARVIPLLVFALLYEGRHMMTYNFEDCSETTHSEVLKKAQNLPGEYVLSQLPIANRFAEANAVLSTIGKFPLLTNGLSGFEPEYYQRLHPFEGQWTEIGSILQWAGEVWPPAYLIVDFAWVGNLEEGWKKPFPLQTVEQGWEPVARDQRFALYRQKQVPVINADRIVRRLRTDMLKTHPLLTFTARSTDPEPATVSVSVNGLPVSENLALVDSWQNYAIPLPVAAMGNIKGEEVTLCMVSPVPTARHWEVREIGFKSVGEPSIGSYARK